MPICDYWMIIDNTTEPYKKIADGNKLSILNMLDEELYTKIVK